MRCIRGVAPDVWLLLSMCMTLAGAGCQPESAPQPFPDAERRAEEALRQVGQGLFEVVSFRVEDHEQRVIDDSYRHGTSIYRMRFVGDIRYQRDVRIRSPDQTLEWLRQPATSAKDVEQEIVWRRLLGEGLHGSGSGQQLRSVAVFEETESGWRFVAIDGPEIEVH